MEVRQHSILETAAVDSRTVVEIHILQVEKVVVVDTAAAPSGKVRIQAGEDMSFVAIENIYSAAVAGWGHCPAFPTRNRDRGRVAVGGIVGRIVWVAVELV